MKWYGTFALVFSLFLLAGIVYAGANTDKVGFVLVPFAFAQENTTNTSWIQNLIDWLNQGQLSDDEFNAAIDFLVSHRLFQIDSNNNITPVDSDEKLQSCPIETFLDVSDFDGAGSSYPKPSLNV